MKNSYLLIILIILAGGYFLLKNVKSPQREKNYKIPEIIMDTAKVNEIKLYTKAQDHQELKFVKEKDQWMLGTGDKNFKAQRSRVKAMIYELSNLKIDRVVSTQKDKWMEYEVDDSSGSRVVVYERGKEILDLYIGKLSFVQNPSAMQQQQPSGLSYIRFNNSNEVLVTEGFLPITFNQAIGSFRDNTFIKAEKDNISRIEFEYPSDSSFAIYKRDSAWYIGDLKIDTDKTEAYLQEVSKRKMPDFADEYKVIREPDFQLKLSGTNMEEVTIKVYQEEEEYYMQSSANMQTMFKSNGSGVFAKLFKGKKFFKEKNSLQ
ncbi:MAG: DUF4340 domain-containing protein [Chitinophagales bacterium]|nr:DUF4340 domain-containing protein [Chitinophagales bacterium]